MFSGSAKKQSQISFKLAKTLFKKNLLEGFYVLGSLELENVRERKMQNNL